MRAMEISLSGMDVEWRRLEMVAANLANASTVLNGKGDAYRAMHLISGPRMSFRGQLDRADALTQDVLGGVEVYGVEPIDLPPRHVYEPGNPQADPKGYVSYPGVDMAQQMTLMIKTARAYEANVVSMSMARQMYAKALEIGR